MCCFIRLVQGENWASEVKTELIPNLGNAIRSQGSFGINQSEFFSIFDFTSSFSNVFVSNLDNKV